MCTLDQIVLLMHSYKCVSYTDHLEVVMAFLLLAENAQLI